MKYSEGCLNFKVLFVNNLSGHIIKNTPRAKQILSDAATAAAPNAPPRQSLPPLESARRGWAKP